MIHFLALLTLFLYAAPTFCQTAPTNLVEKKIVVIIPSFNNAPYYEKNISSVLTQDYSNYRIIYIDDCSTDGTGALVEQLIKDNHLENTITLMKNNYSRKALSNLYRAAHLCDPTDIILELDGDDWLTHNQVLKKINELFSTTDTWLAYAQYMNVPEEKAKELKMSIIGYARETPPALIASREFRGKWLWSGLRMFYAWLFDGIKLEDLLLPEMPYKGKFFPTSKDGAIMYPMLEMAGSRIKFIPEILLDRNVDTPLNDFKVGKELQQHCGKALLASPQYPLLNEPTTQSNYEQPKRADMLIFADTNKEALEMLLDSCIENIKAIGTIHVVEHQKHTIQEIKSLINAMTNDYILIAHNNVAFTKPVDLSTCIKTLDTTYAHAFYFGLGLNDFGDPQQKITLPCEQIIDDIFAWKFSCFEPQSINDFGVTLYRKNDLLDLVKNGQKSLHDFAKGSRKIGLFFEKTKVALR
ncbi:MAG: glycosyltransferase family A protein [Candidatus Dependentiae bacterium]|nr:glycosyltransferase family A protein [Candidatus Dependentiae bacterium]